MHNILNLQTGLVGKFPLVGNNNGTFPEVNYRTIFRTFGMITRFGYDFLIVEILQL